MWFIDCSCIHACMCLCVYICSYVWVYMCVLCYRKTTTNSPHENKIHQPGKCIFTVACVFAPVHYFLIRTWWPWCTRLWRENSLGYPITSTTILESSSEGENSLSYPITSTTILDANTEMSKPPAIVAILQNLPLQISITLISILPCTI